MTTVEQELHRRDLPMHSAVLVTMLRSPAERVISEHKYALARPNKNKESLQFLQQQDGGGDSFGQLMKALRHNMTLTDYVNFPFEQGDYGSIANRQVSLLSGSEHSHERGELQLRYALRNLQLFDFVGLQEDFPASMRLLAHVLTERLGHSDAIDAMATQSADIHVNAAAGTAVKPAAAGHSHSAELSDEVRKAVAKKNNLDSALYDWAKEDFYRKLCDQLGECDGPPAAAADADAQPASTADVTADKPTALSGTGKGMSDAVGG